MRAGASKSHRSRSHGTRLSRVHTSLRLDGLIFWWVISASALEHMVDPLNLGFSDYASVMFKNNVR